MKISWWKKHDPLPNIVSVSSVHDLLEVFAGAGDKLVLIDVYAGELKLTFFFLREVGARSAMARSGGALARRPGKTARRGELLWPPRTRSLSANGVG